jgi:hypothetical protein
MALQRLLSRFSPPGSSSALSAPLIWPRFSRRSLSRDDVRFALLFGALGLPFTAYLYGCMYTAQQAHPYVERLRARFAAVEPELWLALERLSGREGEVSESVRRRNAFMEGKEYSPVVVPPAARAPSAEEMARLRLGEGARGEGR